MTQQPGQSPQSFIGRLKAKAHLCKFEVETLCNTDCLKDTAVKVQYLEDAVESQMIAGLVNPDHQQKLLIDATTNPNLADKMAFLDTIFMPENSLAAAEGTIHAQKSEYSKLKSSGRKCTCGLFIESSNDKHVLCKKCIDIPLWAICPAQSCFEPFVLPKSFLSCFGTFYLIFIFYFGDFQ